MKASEVSLKTLKTNGGSEWGSNPHLNVVSKHAGQQMTPKTTKSNDSHANRAQIERARRLDPVPDDARFGVNPMIALG